MAFSGSRVKDRRLKMSNLCFFLIATIATAATLNHVLTLPATFSIEVVPLVEPREGSKEHWSCILAHLGLIGLRVPES